MPKFEIRKQEYGYSYLFWYNITEYMQTLMGSSISLAEIVVGESLKDSNSEKQVEDLQNAKETAKQIDKKFEKDKKISFQAENSIKLTFVSGNTVYFDTVGKETFVGND